MVIPQHEIRLLCTGCWRKSELLKHAHHHHHHQKTIINHQSSITNHQSWFNHHHHQHHHHHHPHHPHPCPHHHYFHWLNNKHIAIKHEFCSKCSMKIVPKPGFFLLVSLQNLALSHMFTSNMFKLSKRPHPKIPHYIIPSQPFPRLECYRPHQHWALPGLRPAPPRLLALHGAGQQRRGANRLRPGQRHGGPGFCGAAGAGTKVPGGGALGEGGSDQVGVGGVGIGIRKPMVKDGENSGEYGDLWLTNDGWWLSGVVASKIRADRLPEVSARCYISFVTSMLHLHGTDSVFNSALSQFEPALKDFINEDLRGLRNCCVVLESGWIR